MASASRLAARRAMLLGIVGRLGAILWSGGSLAAVALAAYVGWSAQDFATRAVRIEGVVSKVDVRQPEPGSIASKLAERPPGPDSKSDGKTSGEKAGGETAGAKAEPKPVYVATITYTSPSGEALSTTREVGDAALFKANQKVALLVDPKAPQSPRVEASDQAWAGPIVLGVFGAVFAVLGWQFARKPAIAAFEDKWHDETKFDFHPLNPGTLDSYLGAVTVAPTGIPATATAIREGKYPLALCEMMAYMSTLAYEEDKDLERFLNARLPAISDYRFFNQGHTQGFGFVYEGIAFIVMRGTEGRGDWRQNIRAFLASPTELIPKGATWTAPERHRGFAEAWDLVRDDVEAWVALRPPQMPLIFSGHSLGGALAFVGAFEQAMQGRNIAAVITFGAPMVGRSEWADAYKKAGLDDRTLRLSFDQDLVPLILQYLGYRHVGREWLPDKPPLVHSKVLIKAAIAGALVGLVQWGMTSGKKTWREKLQGPFTRKLILFMTYAGPFALFALAAHKMQTRYSLALSTIAYQRIRQIAAPNRTETEYAACYDKLSRHLARIRGSTPQEPDRYGDIKNLPNMIASPVDLAWFGKWYPKRMF